MIACPVEINDVIAAPGTLVGVYDGDRLELRRQVRAGFVPHLRREVYDKLKRAGGEDLPVANLPEKRRTQWALTVEEMKECRWLKPVKVAQIEFTEWTPDGHLRHSSFAGLRDDKDAQRVVRE
jgi:bifunctional non-homologous end joining protein LigD